MPAFSTKKTAAGITAWARRSREGAEKSQRMTAALKNMPWRRVAMMQPVFRLKRRSWVIWQWHIRALYWRQEYNNKVFIV